MPRLTDEQWTRALEDVRAARGSMREIAARHGVSHTALQKRAEKAGVKADLVVEVKAETERRLMLVKGDKPSPKVAKGKVATKVAKPNARTDDEIVEEAAAERESIVRSHRRDVAAARATVQMLQEQLALFGKSQTRELVEALILANTDPKATQVRAAMQKAVSLPSHAGIAKDLATAQRTLVMLERQAYRIDEKGGSEGGLEAWLRKLAEEEGQAAA